MKWQEENKLIGFVFVFFNFLHKMLYFLSITAYKVIKIMNIK